MYEVGSFYRPYPSCNIYTCISRMLCFDLLTYLLGVVIIHPKQCSVWSDLVQLPEHCTDILIWSCMNNISERRRQRRWNGATDTVRVEESWIQQEEEHTSQQKDDCYCKIDEHIQIQMVEQRARRSRAFTYPMFLIFFITTRCVLTEKKVWRPRW